MDWEDDTEDDGESADPPEFTTDDFSFPGDNPSDDNPSGRANPDPDTPSNPDPFGDEQFTEDQFSFEEPDGAASQQPPHGTRPTASQGLAEQFSLPDSSGDSVAVKPQETEQQARLRRELCETFNNFVKRIPAVTYTTRSQYQWADEQTLLLAISVQVDVEDPFVAHEYNQILSESEIIERDTPLEVRTEGDDTDLARGSDIKRLVTCIETTGIIAFDDSWSASTDLFR